MSRNLNALQAQDNLTLLILIENQLKLKTKETAEKYSELYDELQKQISEVIEVEEEFTEEFDEAGLQALKNRFGGGKVG